MFRSSLLVVVFLCVSCGAAATHASAPTAPQERCRMEALPEPPGPGICILAPPTDGAEASGLTEVSLVAQIPGGVSLWREGRRAEQPTAVTITEACYELSCETTCMVRLLVPVEVWCRERP